MWTIQQFHSLIIIVFLAIFFNQDPYVNWKLVISFITQYIDFENEIIEKYFCCWPARFYQWWDCIKVYDYRWQQAALLSWWSLPYIEKNVCECYNVIVDVPTTRLQLVHPDKTSHSKENWNNNVEAGLFRSSFDSIAKMLELSTDKKVTFVVERLNSVNLKHEVNNRFFSLLNLMSLIL